MVDLVPFGIGLFLLIDTHMHEYHIVLSPNRDTIFYDMFTNYLIRKEKTNESFPNNKSF